MRTLLSHKPARHDRMRSVPDVEKGAENYMTDNLYRPRRTVLVAWETYLGAVARLMMTVDSPWLRNGQARNLVEATVSRVGALTGLAERRGYVSTRELKIVSELQRVMDEIIDGEREALRVKIQGLVEAL